MNNPFYEYIPCKLLRIALDTVEMVRSLASREQCAPWAGDGGGALVASSDFLERCWCASDDRCDVSATNGRSTGDGHTPWGERGSIGRLLEKAKGEGSRPGGSAFFDTVRRYNSCDSDNANRLDPNVTQNTGGWVIEIVKQKVNWNVSNWWTRSKQEIERKCKPKPKLKWQCVTYWRSVMRWVNAAKISVHCCCLKRGGEPYVRANNKKKTRVLLTCWACRWRWCIATVVAGLCPNPYGLPKLKNSCS